MTTTEYNLNSLPIGTYTLYVTAYKDTLETKASNVVTWIKASIKYVLANVTVKSSVVYFTTDTAASITFERAFGYVLPTSVEVDSAQQNSYEAGVLVISEPTSSEVTITASGVKDTSVTIMAGTYTFAITVPVIKETLTETVNFTYTSAGGTTAYTSIVAMQSGAIVFKNGDITEQPYSGTVWVNNLYRTITVTANAKVSADFLAWFNKAMQGQLATPVISITGRIVTWAAIENATTYVIRDNTDTIATTTSTSFNLSSFGNTLGAGTHYINVIARADYFKDSDQSNLVDYVVYALYEPVSVGFILSGGSVIFSGQFVDNTATGATATGANIYEETSQGVYDKIQDYDRGDVQSTSIQAYLGSANDFEAGAHTYMARCVDSTGVYADSPNSASVTLGIYNLTWNVTNITAPSRNKLIGNDTYFVTITPDEDVELPETITVQGATYTWTVGSNGKGTLRITGITATTYTSGVTVTITAVKKAKVEAGTYYWKNIEPSMSSSYIEAKFAFKSGETAYSKMSSGDSDYLKYDDTTVYSITSGSVWEPETARTITVETDQYIPQAAYNFFFAGLEKQ